MAYINAHRHDVVDGREVGVEPVCAVLKKAGVQIAPSSYYAAKNRPPSARAVRDAELVTDIKVAHKANIGVYGARKIHAELNREGLALADDLFESGRDVFPPGWAVGAGAGVGEPDRGDNYIS